MTEEQQSLNIGSPMASDAALPPQAGASCLHCNYDLTGLSRVGKCPECGHHYDLDFMATILTPQNRFELALRRWSSKCFAVAAFAFFAWGCYMQWVREARHGFVVMGLFALISTMISFLCRQSERAYMEQLLDRPSDFRKLPPARPFSEAPPPTKPS